jgi:NTP pyrophosphatase (non-canonical NTP hydrolase)
MALYLSVLRKANEARQAVWPGAQQITDEFRLAEVLGELGEFFEAFKKYERNRLNITGSKCVLEDLGDEAADAVIAIDLSLMHLGIRLLPDENTVDPFGASLSRVAYFASHFSLHLAAFDHRPMLPEQKTALRDRAVEFIHELEAFLLSHGLRLDDCIRVKFNVTSMKYKLPVKIGQDWDVITSPDKPAAQ